MKIAIEAVLLPLVRILKTHKPKNPKDVAPSRTPARDQADDPGSAAGTAVRVGTGLFQHQQQHHRGIVPCRVPACGEC